MICTATDAAGPNRLTQRVRWNPNWTYDTTLYSYDKSGAMLSETKSGLSETFAYDHVNGLVKKYRRVTGGMFGTVQEWRYRYSASGEREQKRQYESVADAPKEWTYYLLGLSKEQLAVYEGLETTQSTCGPTSPLVYLWATEYLTYGLGDAHSISTRPTSPTTSEKEYKLQDHLGSTRVVLDQTGSIRSTTDYEPFGAVATQTGQSPRKSYIDKEVDDESGLGDFGARKQDSEIGRFTSIDLLWEQYRSLSPYQYAGNNPLVIADPSGMAFEYDDTKMKTLYKDYYAVAPADVQKRLDVLENDPNVTYRIEEWQGNATSTNVYDFKNDKMLLRIGALHPNQIGALADELTHAYQFQTGEIGYMLDNNNKVRSVGYDVDDEIASKDAFINATTAYNAAHPNQSPLLLGPVESQYQAATNKASFLIAHYHYGGDFAPDGKQIGRAVPGNLGLSFSDWLIEASFGTRFSKFVYREIENGQMVTRRNP